MPAIDPMLQELRDAENRVFLAKRLDDYKAQCIRLIEQSKLIIKELLECDPSSGGIEWHDAQIKHCESELRRMEETNG